MFWLSLAFFIVAIVGSIGVAAMRGWRLWRTFSGASRQADDALARLTASAAAAEARANSLDAHSERLATAIASLQDALAEFQAIRAAAAEPLALLAEIRGIVPHK